MKYVLRQTLRGTQTLPIVGSHPGTGIVIGLSVIMVVAAQSAMGLLFALPLIALYLYGSYERAEYSDRKVSQ